MAGCTQEEIELQGCYIYKMAIGGNMTEKIPQYASYLLTLILSLLFLFIGSLFAGQIPDGADDGIAYYRAHVINIFDRVDINIEGFSSTEIHFNARITSRERRGELVRGVQSFSDMIPISEAEIEPGSNIILASIGDMYFFANYQRINIIAILGGVFFVLIIAFGQAKGFNSIVSLGFICAAVFFVLIPAILNGRNIYILTIIICLYAIISTLFIVIGTNKKALSAMFGCLGGVSVAAGLMFFMDFVLNLTGMLDHETVALLRLENPVDIRALIFAGVIIGAMGAIMDVAMSISSSLFEICELEEDISFTAIFSSGINIGKDILGTMLNTLVLAYIGGSLSVMMLLMVHSTSVIELLNMEMIIVEFLRAIIGSFGMFAAIPLTAFICGLLYTKKSKRRKDEDYFDDYFTPERLQSIQDIELPEEDN